ncbi:MAG: multiple sugar transport system substrate-binding protein [Clostridium butyricum]|nr:multiple sugar transport system substrate-binding protein [Clostridium butyricum]
MDGKRELIVMFKIKLKFISLIICMLIIVSSVSACSSKGSNNSNAQKESKSVTQITVWYPWSGPDGNVIKQWAEDFNKTHPNIEVNAQMVSGSGIGSSQGKFQTAVAGGNPPDAVLYWDYTSIPSLASQGLIEPLDNLLSDIKEDGSKFTESSWNSVKFDGKIYGLPEMTSDLVFFWNKDMFKNVGLDPDKPPTTLQEVDDMAQKLTLKQNGKYVHFGFIPWIGQGTPLSWAGLFGVQDYVVNDKPNLEKNTGLEKILEWEASYSKKYDPNQINNFFAALSQNNADQNDPFILGKVAMKVDGMWEINNIKQYAPNLNYGVAPIPTAPGGKENSSVLLENVWMIPKGAKHASEALQFIEWTYDVHRQADAGDQVFNISPVKEATKLQKINNDPKAKVCIDLMTSGHVSFLVQSKATLATQNALNNAFQAAQYLQKTPQEALKQAQSEAEQTLAQQGSK